MTSPKPPQGGPYFWQGDPGAPTGYRAVTQFSWSQHTQFADTYRYLKNLQNCGLWHKCLHADLLDGKHGPALIDAFNASDWDATEYNDADVDHPNFNDTTPAAPNGGLNGKWQTDDDSNVSVYVPFSSITTATPASADYVVGTDTDNSNNPKRFLLSDLLAAISAAPVDPQYVTLATNATLTNERVLTAGTGLDLADGGAGSTVTITPSLDELSPGTAAAADSVVFIDADDSTNKLTSMADLATALTAVTAASVFAAANRVLIAGGNDRSADDSDFTMTQDGTKTLNTHDGSALTITPNTVISGTLASGAHTITHAATASITAASTPMLDLNSALSGSNVRKRVFPVRASVTAGTTLVSWAIANGDGYMFRFVGQRKRTDSGGQINYVDYKFHVQDIGGTLTIQSSFDDTDVGGLAASPMAGNSTKGGTPFLLTFAPTAGTEVWNGHVEVLGPLNA